MLLEASGIVKQFGSLRAVDGACLAIDRGEVVGLIGPNGAGKSTFFNCLAGEVRPEAGRIIYKGADITALSPEAHARRGIARTWQVPAVFAEMPVRDNVMVGAFLRHHHAPAARRKAEEVSAFTGLAQQAGAPAGSLGTLGRKRLEIARALATEPELVLLDEALAGLNPTETAAAIELVRSIHAAGITLVIVEHVMAVILSLAQRAVVFHQGKVIAAGPPAAVIEDEAVIEAYLGARFRRRSA